uniref:Uncharacterized protein n=1 Tax=Cajanus cajan TaxID=3821 RepID=A0A151SX87_CAJCA|nr:hypothetical protein KK1_014853 [Cajanus cajan]
MFILDEWNSNKLSKEAIGRKTSNIVLIYASSLTYSSFGYERNCNVFKRNRLEHKGFHHDLIYVKYDQVVKRRDNLKDEGNPISLNDIDECNKCLIGDMDSDDDEAQNKRILDGDDPFTCGDVFRALEAIKPIMYTRHNKRKQLANRE